MDADALAQLIAASLRDHEDVSSVLVLDNFLGEDGPVSLEVVTGGGTYYAVRVEPL